MADNEDHMPLPSLVAAFFGALVDVWSVLELRSEEILELPFPKNTGNATGHVRTPSL